MWDFFIQLQTLNQGKPQTWVMPKIRWWLKNMFCCTGLELARSRWVRSTFSSKIDNFFPEIFLVMLRIKLRAAGWEASKLCNPHDRKIFVSKNLGSNSGVQVGRRRSCESRGSDTEQLKSASNSLSEEQQVLMQVYPAPTQGSQERAIRTKATVWFSSVWRNL